MNTDLNPPSAPDAFETVRNLIAILASPPKATRLLNELERRMGDVKAAEAKLSADRDAHQRTVANERAELDDRRSKLVAKELDLIRRESLAEKILEREKSDLRDRYRPLSEGTTITREPA
jgi:hypothetical protein